MDLLNHRNHLNDWCTRVTPGRCQWSDVLLGLIHGCDRRLGLLRLDSIELPIGMSDRVVPMLLNWMFMFDRCQQSKCSAAYQIRMGLISSVLKIRTICHAETGEKLIGLHHSCVCYVHQTRVIYHVLPYSVDFKVPGSFEIH